MPGLVIGVDSSTTATKVEVRDTQTGQLVATGSHAHPPTGPPPRSEQDPGEWWAALVQAVHAAGRYDVDAIAVAGQQHGMVVVDEAGQVIRPALLWNDLRSAPAAAALIRERGGPLWWATQTGSVPTASFTVTKLRWLAEHEPQHADLVRAVMLPHDWLTWRLRGGPGDLERPAGHQEAGERSGPAASAGPRTSGRALTQSVSPSTIRRRSGRHRFSAGDQ